MIKQIILPVLLLASITAAAEDLFLREYTVRSEADFTRAVAAINGSQTAGTYRITLAANIQADNVTFTAVNTEKTVVIQGDTAVRSIVSIADLVLFIVNKGITLSLENNLRLDGNGKEYRTVWVDGGGLVIKAGSCIEGAKGGAVCVVGDGVITMSGGEIRGNEGGSGGGVYVLKGTFTMSGGEICENESYAGGGGVNVGLENSLFTMTGGTIRGNKGRGGGGVYVYDRGTFTMSGGEISGNQAGESGGGVGVYAGMFEMSGGTISGNIAESGGGIRVWDGTVTMSDGEIRGNTASSTGGGVYIIEDGVFTKNGGGTIGGNTAPGGRAAYIYLDENNHKQRNADAGPDVNMDSAIGGAAGGWE